jgi:hypothetical protein
LPTANRAVSKYEHAFGKTVVAVVVLTRLFGVLIILLSTFLGLISLANGLSYSQDAQTSAKFLAAAALALLFLGARAILHTRPPARLAMFDREFKHFRKHVASMPECKGVQVYCTRRKGGRVYLHGHVLHKEVHDRLLQAYERMVHSNDSGCYDGVEYPGRPQEIDRAAAEDRVAEPGVGADSR